MHMLVLIQITDSLLPFCSLLFRRAAEKEVKPLQHEVVRYRAAEEAVILQHNQYLG